MPATPQLTHDTVSGWTDQVETIRDTLAAENETTDDDHHVSEALQAAENLLRMLDNLSNNV